MRRAHALLEALLVTFLWSTSYVLIKIGLKEVNPLSFAAYRYLLGSAILVLFVLLKYKEVRITSKQILWVILLGFTGYTVAQGLQFVGLSYLPAITVTFLLNLTPLFVVFLSVVFLREVPSPVQLLGIVAVLTGVGVFFSESTLVFDEVIGIVVTLVSGVGWASYMVIMRYYLKRSEENVIALTSWSMVFGAAILFGVAGLSGNLVLPSLKAWSIIVFLAIINTALAFVLWNHALKVLKAYEQSILQNTMLIQITLLAYTFLGERLTFHKVVGLGIVFCGVLLVQLYPNIKKENC
ncbi:DMT family transporter [Palaeococcus pacificus]|nr:DMT family transporter [Palaeococcus pacificus]